MRARARALGALLACLVAALLAVPGAAQAALLGSSEQAWQPNGAVHAVEPVPGARVLIGGSFDNLGPQTGSSVRVGSDASAERTGTWPTFASGTVEAIVEDGAGGWYVGGSFHSVNGVQRPRLVHVTAAGTVDPVWGVGAGPNGGVTALALDPDSPGGPTLYVGGSFSEYDGAPAGRLVAVDAASGARRAGWGGAIGAGSAGSIVRDLAVHDGKLYVAGEVDAWDGAPVRNLFRVDSADGLLDGSWQSGGTTGAVHALALAPDGVLYVGGSFASIGTALPQGRQRFAAVDLATDTIQPVAVAFSGTVTALAVDGTRVYVGGEFASPQPHLMAIDRTSGTSAWPNVNLIAPPGSAGRRVTALAVHAGTVYVGGAFLKVDSAVRHRAAALDAASGTLRTWNPMLGQPAHAVAFAGGDVVLGGEFMTANGVQRSYLASIDPATGVPDAWAPTMPFPVWAIASDGTVVFAGGDGPQLRAYQLANGAPVPPGYTAPSFTGGSGVAIRALEIVGSQVYVGGSFTQVDATPRSNLSPVTWTGSPTVGSWPTGPAGDTDAAVETLRFDGSSLYVGGSFTTILGMSQPRLARLVGSTVDPAFRPVILGSAVTDTSVTGGVAYLAGSFTMIDGVPRPGLAALRTTDGELVAGFAPTVGSGAVTAVHADPGGVFVGGSFGQLNGEARTKLAQLDASGATQGWNPQLTWPWTTGVEAIAMTGGSIVVAGADGVSIFTSTADSVPPRTQLLGIVEPAPGDPSDGVYVRAGNEVVVRPHAGAPSFTVQLRAHDQYEGTDATYASVSGLAKVSWPGVDAARGDWTPGTDSEEGAPRGLQLRCYQNADFNGTTVEPVAVGIDRAIDYPLSLQPDRLPAYPALLRSRLDGYDEADSYQLMSCRWRGQLIAPSNAAGSWTFQGFADNGMRVNVGGDPDVTGWPTLDEWDVTGLTAVSAPITFDAGEAKPLTVEWWENSGTAAAVLQWAGPSTGGTMLTIPEGAFATKVDYARTYRYTGGAATDGTSTLQITGRDRAGLTSAPALVKLTTDSTPPNAPATFTATPNAGWSSASSVQLELEHASPADLGAGFDRGWFEQRSAPLADGDCDDAAASSWTQVGPIDTDEGAVALPVVGLGEGCHQFRYVMEDKVGNRGEFEPNGQSGYASWWKLDATSPSGGSVDYVANVTSATSLAIDVTEPSDAGSGLDPAATELVRETASYSAGACGGMVSISHEPVASSVALVDGTCVRFGLRGRDLAGNTWSVPTGAMVQVDHTAPTATLDAPPAGAIAGPVTITGTASDDASGIAQLTLRAGGEDICDASTWAGATWSATCDTTQLDDGPHALELVVRDAAGNETTDSATLAVDNAPPSLTVSIDEVSGVAYQHVDPLDPSHLWINPARSGSFRVDAGAVDAASGVMLVQFPDLVTGFSPGGVASTAPYRHDYDWLAGADQPPLMPAPTITASDLAGNGSSATMRIEHDATAPVGGSIEFTNGVSSSVTVTTTAASDAGGSGIASTTIQRRASVTDTGGACAETWGVWTAVAADPPLTWNDTTVQRARCYQYRLVVIDNVGNEAVHESSSGAMYVTDTPGVLVTAVTTPATVTEGGAGTTVQVSLRAAPMAPVTIDVVGDGQVTAAPTSITFTTTNWSTARTVTISAVDDDIDEPSPANAGVRFEVRASGDPDYDPIAPITRTVQVIDDDVAALRIGAPASGVSVSEGGTGATWDVGLATRPVGPVTVTLGAGAQATVSPATLTFTPTNWSTRQQVTVTAIDDPHVEGEHASSVTHTVAATAAGDAPYAALGAATVAVTITDNDTPGLDVQLPAGSELAEGDAARQETVRVRLRARPTAPVTVRALGVGDQLVASPASLTFAPDGWDAWQAITVSAKPDTIAEPPAHAALLQLDTTSADATFHALQPTVATFTVSDDDTAGFTFQPGQGADIDAEGRLRLVEGAVQASVLRLRTIGDPASDVTITPQLTPADQLEVLPASVTIPAGAHDHVVTFRVRAVNDRLDEQDPHPAKITWRVSTSDAMYGAVSIPATVVRISDAPSTKLRETTPPAQEEPATSTPPPGSNEPSSAAPTSPGGDEGGPPPFDGGEEVRASDDDAATDESGRDGSEDRAATAPPERERAARRRTSEDEPRSVAGRLRNWASENKGKASVAASAAGTAALWAAKPLAIAGKALASGGGGLTNPPPGLTQIRHLLKLRRKQRRARLLWKLRGRRGPSLRDMDDDDWDDFFWGNRAA